MPPSKATIIKSLSLSIALLIGATQWVPRDNPNSEQLSLSELPNGEYYYLDAPRSELSANSYVLLHKWGRIAIGIDVRPPSGSACFKGFIQDNRIVDATRVLPPYTPDAQWDYQPGDMLDLSYYNNVADPVAEEVRANLEICLDVFAR